MTLEQLYLRLPIALQNLSCSLQGWRIQRSRFGSDFWSKLSESQSRTFWSSDCVCSFRDRRLREFLIHCQDHVPFYRRSFRKIGFDARNFRRASDLQELPILTKAVVQSSIEEFYATDISRDTRIPVHTSGTTGGGLCFFSTSGAVQEQWATWWRYRAWHGVRTDSWCGYFGGRSVVPIEQQHPPYWRYNNPGRQILFSAYHVRPETSSSYVNELRRSKPPWLHGYPSFLASIASSMIESGASLGYVPSVITIGAENLLPQQSQLIESAFGVRPRQHYGLAEAVANISECERGFLHVDEDFAMVEFLPIGRGNYKVIGTNFSNPATPFVRYDTNDVVALSDNNCNCGRPGRIVERIDGRAEDYVVLANGARVGRLDHILKDMVHIREAQIVQMKPGELIFRVVRGSGYSNSDEEALRREAEQRIGGSTTLAIEYVDRIERTERGKLRFVVSHVARDLSARQILN